VEAAATTRDLASLVFEPAHVIERLRSMGDLYQPVLELEQELPGLKG
jgi:hypothetical protein